MATNPFYKTYYAPSEKVENHTLYLSVRFQRNYSGTSDSDLFSEHNINIIEWGRLELSYDYDSQLLVPAVLDITLFDGDGTLATELFGDTAVYLDDTDKRARVELRIDGTTEFVGFFDEESIEYDIKTKILKFTATPQIDIINEKMIYDLDDNVLNPFSYTWASSYKLTEYLEDIFSLVDSGNTWASGRITIVHDWLFKGQNQIDFSWKDDFVITDLYLDPAQLYNNSNKVHRTCGDVLRQLAKDFGGFAGMIHNQKAFFKKLFKYNSSSTQTLGQVINHKQRYYKNILSYVRVKNSVTSYDEGNFEGVEGTYLDYDSLMYFYNNVINTGGYSGNGSSVKAVFGDQYVIYGAKDSVIDSNWHDHGDLLAKFWYEFRAQMKYNNIEEFEVIGIDYDFLKDFTYDGNQYQIIRLTKYLSENYSEIEAINLH